MRREEDPVDGWSPFDGVAECPAGRVTEGLSLQAIPSRGEATVFQQRVRRKVSRVLVGATAL